MDCFAVSLAIGTTTRSQLRKTALVIAASFGFFQAGMTIVGWIAGTSLYTVISAYDHWIAFLLLAGIGIKMIHDGMKEETGTHFTGLHVIPVLLLSVATSIDALAAGVSFGVLGIFGVGTSDCDRPGLLRVFLYRSDVWYAARKKFSGTRQKSPVV